MPISLILQPDAGSIEFARQHATASFGARMPADSLPGLPGGTGGGDFASYLASVMGGAAQRAGEITPRSETGYDSPRNEYEHTSTRIDREPLSTGPGSSASSVSKEDTPIGEAGAKASKSMEGSGRDDRNEASGDAAERRAGADDATTHGNRRETDRAAAAKGGADARGSETKAAREAATKGAQRAAAGGRATAGVAAEPGIAGRAGGRANAGVTGKRATADSAAAQATESKSSKASGQDAPRVVELDVHLAEEVDPAAETARRQTASDEARSHHRDGRKAGGAGSRAAQGVDANAATAERAAADADRTRGGRSVRGGDESRIRESDTEDARIERRVEVRDLRARRNDARGEGGTRKERGDLSNAIDRSASEAASKADAGDRASDRSTSFESLRAEAGSGPGQSGRAEAQAARMPANVAAQLRRALGEQTNGEIVRSARFIVRNNDSGEIRLHLKPESLGSVRIALHMQDGRIVGRITVENQSVRDAFEQNLAALQKAFAESGMDAGGLEVSVADSGNDSGQTPDGLSEGADRRTAASRFENTVPLVSLIDEIHDLVDMVV